MKLFDTAYPLALVSVFHKDEVIIDRQINFVGSIATGLTTILNFCVCVVIA